MLCVRCPGQLGSGSPVCSLGALCCVCGVLGQLAPVHCCEWSACYVVYVVSWATWLLFTVVYARCVPLCVRCPGPLGSCSPVCSLGALCCVCGVLGHLAPVRRCICSACYVAYAVTWATWLLFTGVYARCVPLCVRCPGPLGSCSPVCSLGMLCCLCGVLGHLAPVHRCAGSVRGVACAVSRATWLLFTGAHARCVVLRVRFPGPIGSCSPVFMTGVSCCVCGVLDHLGPVHRWHARFIVRCPQCPGQLGSCSPVCTLRLLSCVYGVLGHLAPVHRCACSACRPACAVSWATWLLFTGAHAPCVVPCVQCPGPLGSFSPVHTLHVLCCLCGVLGLLAPVNGCARWVCSLGVLCCVLCVRYPGPLGSCAPVCALAVLLTHSFGGPGHGTLRWTRTSEQAGKALRSQGHHCARVM